MFGCLGWGFKVYTLLPSKYGDDDHINDSLDLGMALPQTPKSCVPWQSQWIHTFLSGSRCSFHCHFHSCRDDAPRLAVDPSELWNMIVWTASGEIQEVLWRTSKSRATMASFPKGICILTWTNSMDNENKVIFGTLVLWKYEQFSLLSGKNYLQVLRF